MRSEFFVHNLFKSSVDRYLTEDPHLKRAAENPFHYESSLLRRDDLYQPGIFVLTGGRQVGKSTFLKQFITALLKEYKTVPKDIVFLAGELIRDDHELRLDIQDAVGDDGCRKFIVVDEISYVKDWDKAVKFLADAGVLERVTLILSGSDSGIIRDAMKRFAGRRGRAQDVDLVFHPLSFCETAVLKDSSAALLLERVAARPLLDDSPEAGDDDARLLKFFEEYLLHGGYLTAIADHLRYQATQKPTLRTYSEWIRGDILKHNKQEKYLMEILRGILETYASQVSWNALSKRMSIDHHRTVADYVMLLEDLNVIWIHEALIEHKLSAAPKKAKKLYFRDPFIYHTVLSMVGLPSFSDEASRLAEGAVVSHLKRRSATYYIKGAKGEVDAAVIQGRGFLPVEIKWSERIRPEEIKQVMTLGRGLVLDKSLSASKMDGLGRLPAARFLVHWERGTIDRWEDTK